MFYWSNTTTPRSYYTSDSSAISYSGSKLTVSEEGSYTFLLSADKGTDASTGTTFTIGVNGIALVSVNTSSSVPSNRKVQTTTLSAGDYISCTSLGGSSAVGATLWVIKN